MLLPLRAAGKKGESDDDLEAELTIEVDDELTSVKDALDRSVRDSYSAKAGEVDQAVWDDNADLNIQMQWVAILDGDTCPECEDLDGELFDIDAVDGPPLHPNCRCVLSPVIDDQSVEDVVANLVEE